MTKVRFGILGAGRILAKLGAGFRHSTKAQLVAIASRELPRASAAAAQHGAARACGSYEALLDDPDIDVVFNALHNGLHCEWTIRALEAGKHVLCEKPLACSTAEVEQMFAAAHKHRRWLMEGFMYRFQPQIAAAKQAVDSGAIGKLLHIRASFATRGREPGNPRYWPNAGGGALMDIGCYCVNAARLFAGSEPTRMTGHAHFSSDGAVDLTLSGMLEFEGGLSAHVLCSFESEGVYGIELAGTEGKLLIPNPWLPPNNWGEYILTRDGKEESYRQPTPHQLSHFAGEMDHFAGCVRENRAPMFPPSTDAEQDSRGNMRVMEALLQSARATGGNEK
jgi:predicted dehydrogenase